MNKRGIPQRSARVDPISLQVMMNAIYSIADEMIVALIRPPFRPISKIDAIVVVQSSREMPNWRRREKWERHSMWV